MATLSFEKEDGSGCSLPPFNAVSNRLFFFRVNVFEMDMPLHAEPADNKKGTAPFVARLGLPITDLFPNLLPEFGPTLQTIDKSKKGEFKVRLRQGVFLPAATLNKRYSAAHLITPSPADIREKRLRIAGKDIPVRDDEWNALIAGHPVSILVGHSLIRVLPPSTIIAEGPPPGTRFLAFRSSAGAPFDDPRELSDSEFEAFCFALFDNRDDPNFAWLDQLTAPDTMRLRARCRHDPRFPAFDKKRKGKHNLEPPRYEIGFVSEYEQARDLKGYSRGALVSSITLAPDEELTIEVFTWDRSKLEEERTDTTEAERSVETSSLARVSSQLNSELTDTTDKNASLGLGAPLPIGTTGVIVNAKGEGGISNNITQSIASTIETINETTRRASDRFKTTTQVKVVQTRETGSETRVTRRIRNPNRGRTLTMHCFEVMEHYAITTKLLRADKFVLLADVPQPKKFDIQFVLANEEKLQRALLGANFQPGFAAAKKLLAQRFFDRRSRIKAEIEAAQAKARADAAALAAGVPPIVSVAKDMRKKLDRMDKLDLIAEIRTLAEAYLPFGSISHKERAKAEAALGIFNFWLKFKIVTPGMDERAQDFLGAIPETGEVTPQNAYDALSSLTTGLDDAWLTTIKMVAASLVSAQLAFSLLIPFPWLAPVLLEFAVIENDLGLPALIDKAKQLVRAYEATLQQPPPPADSKSELMPPPQLFSLQELALADAEFKQLVLHLELNRVYYMNSLFAQQDVNVRYETLRALGIHTYVENRLLGFLGSRVVLPLRVENLEKEARTYLKDHLTAGLGEQLKALRPIVIDDVSLPTSGLHMEAALGQCDALEPYLHDRRDIDLQTRRAAAVRAEADAQQQVEEVKRLQARLAQTPPVLDSPFATVLSSSGEPDDVLDTADDSTSTSTPTTGPS
jgi:hypothetical protein